MEGRNVHVVVLVNGQVIIGCSMDTMEGLAFVRHPAWLCNERLVAIPGNPREITINDRAIVYDYVSADTKLVAAYNELWREENGKNTDE